MDFKTIEFKVENSVATIKLNRPKELNALSDLMIGEILQAANEITVDDNIRAVVITGEGRAFCAGGDLDDIKDGFGENVKFLKHMEAVNKMVIAFANIPKPVIAAVNGPAVGAGMNMSLAADIIYASENAKFSEIFGQIGLVPDMGGTWLLPRLVGMSKAKELVFTYKMIDAKEALDMGIVHKLVAGEDLLNVTYELANKLAQGPTNAYALAKKMINRCFETDFMAALDFEGVAQSICSASEDTKEGMKAFQEKRKPVFVGR